MIFITVGTQLPFDRLVKELDGFYENTKETVFAQIGPSKLSLKNCEYTGFISPIKAEELFRDASLIIAHAGMGTILTALKYRKPILIVPRKSSLGEHRNEHQLATANWVRELPGVIVADDEKAAVNLLSNPQLLINEGSIPEFAEDRLLNFISKMIKDN